MSQTCSFTYSLKNENEDNIFINFILQRGKLKCKEMKELVQGTCKWWRAVPGNLVSESAHVPLEYLGTGLEATGILTLPINKITV